MANTLIEYQNQLDAHNVAVARKMQLLTIIRMNKLYIGTGLGSKKKRQARPAKIATAETALAALIIPSRPERIIKGFEVYVNGDYEGFQPTQSESEARIQAEEALGHTNFTLKAIYTD